MAAIESMQVQIAYALPERQVILSTGWVSGLTAGQAFLYSGMRAQFPEISEQPELARDGKRIAWNTPVMPGDRIDVLRPLTISPLEARRLRAEVQRKRAKQGQY